MTTAPNVSSASVPPSPLHPTIRQLAESAPDGIRNQHHGIDIAAPSGWVRLCAESDDEDEGYDLHRFTPNWTLLWSIRFSSRTPFAVVCAAIAEALDS